MNKSLSESNLNVENLEKTPPNSYVFTRNKRRWDHEMKTDFTDFKEEMKDMMTTILSSHSNELQRITSTQLEIQQTGANIEKSISFLAAQYEDLLEKNKRLEDQVKEDRKYISILEDKIEDLQRVGRKSNFEIKNVPRAKNERKENLIEIVTCLSKTVGCNLNISDIKDIYRVRAKAERSTTTPIVVETSSTLLKTEILQKCKAFNIRNKEKLRGKHLGLRTGEETPIYVAEQLTPKSSRLHFLARDLAKTKNYKFCWTAFGKVFVRKDENSPIITVHSELQLQELILNK